MVDARHEGQAEFLEFEDTVGQGLVVMDDVEGLERIQMLRDEALAEGPGLREPSRAHGGELEDVDPVTELPHVRDPDGVRLPIEVQAWHLD